MTPWERTELAAKILARRILFWRGINLLPALKYHIARIEYKTENSFFWWKTGIAMLFRRISMSNLRSVDVSVKSAVVVDEIYWKRRDYKDFIIGAESHIEHSVLKTISLKWGFPDFLFAYRWFRFFMKLGGAGFTIGQRVYLTGNLVFFCGVIANFEKYIHIRPHTWIFFNPAVNLECLLAVYLRKRGLKVLGLQHGLYYQFQGDIPLDQLNYQNFQGDSLLCWGRYSFNEMLEYFHENHLLIAGHPIYAGIFPEYKKRVVNTGLVFLSRSHYEISNRKMLAIIEKFADKTGIAIEVKPHPSLNVDDLQRETSLKIIRNHATVNTLLRSGVYQMIISYNTTAYYEGLLRGIPSFRFKDENYQDYPGIKDQFSSLEEMLEIYEFWEKLEDSEGSELIRSVLSEVFGEENSYNQLIN